MSRLEVVENACDGHCAAACGSHGTLALNDVITVDHLALLVGADGDAATDVAHDKVALVVALAHGMCVTYRGFLEVERMQVRIAVHALYAGHASEVAELVRVGWVDHECRLASLLCELIGELAAQLCGMLDAVGSTIGMVEHHVVDGIGATLERHQTTATAHKCIDGV